MTDKPNEKPKITFLDKIPEGARFSGSQIILGLKVPPATIARFERRCEAKIKILAAHPKMSEKDASEAALKQISEEEETQHSLKSARAPV